MFRIGVFLTFLGVMLVYMNFTEFVISFKNPVDYHTLSAAEIKEGMRIEADVDVLLESFADKHTWTEDRNGAQSSKELSAQYYILPVGIESFMAIQAYPKQVKMFDRVVDDTYALMSGETETITGAPIPFTGAVVKLEEDLTGYLKEYLAGGGFEPEEINEIVVPYVLEPLTFTSARIMFLAGVVLLLADAALIAVYFRKRSAAAKVQKTADTGTDIQ